MGDFTRVTQLSARKYPLEEICEAGRGDGCIPLPISQLLFLLRRSSPLQTVCMEAVWRHLWLCRAISWLLAWKLLSLLRKEVAQPQAERSGRTQLPRPSRGIPCSSLVSPWVRAAPGTGYVRFSMAGLDALSRQQPGETVAMALTDGFH